MNNRTLGIIATGVTAVVCGCASLFACIFGILGAMQIPFQTTLNGVEGSAPMPGTLGYVLLCLSLFLLAVPVAVGFFALRTKPAQQETGEPLPPSS